MIQGSGVCREYVSYAYGYDSDCVRGSRCVLRANAMGLTLYEIVIHTMCM